jgi:hypothetical protein
MASRLFLDLRVEEAAFFVYEYGDGVTRRIDTSDVWALRTIPTRAILDDLRRIIKTRSNSGYVQEVHCYLGRLGLGMAYDVEICPLEDAALVGTERICVLMKRSQC